MTAASCKPSKYRSSFSVANASISGNSVVPGLPNMISTPSCLSRSRKARFPDITDKKNLQIDIWLAREYAACAGCSEHGAAWVECLDGDELAPSKASPHLPTLPGNLSHHDPELESALKDAM